MPIKLGLNTALTSCLIRSVQIVSSSTFPAWPEQLFLGCVYAASMYLNGSLANKDDSFIKSTFKTAKAVAIPTVFLALVFKSSKYYNYFPFKKTFGFAATFTCIFSLINQVTLYVFSRLNKSGLSIKINKDQAAHTTHLSPTRYSFSPPPSPSSFHRPSSPVHSPPASPHHPSPTSLYYPTPGTYLETPIPSAPPPSYPYNPPPSETQPIYPSLDTHSSLPTTLEGNSFLYYGNPDTLADMGEALVAKHEEARHLTPHIQRHLETYQNLPPDLASRLLVLLIQIDKDEELDPDHFSSLGCWLMDNGIAIDPLYLKPKVLEETIRKIGTKEVNDLRELLNGEEVSEAYRGLLNQISGTSNKLFHSLPRDHQILLNEELFEKENGYFEFPLRFITTELIRELDEKVISGEKPPTLLLIIGAQLCKKGLNGKQKIKLIHDEVLRRDLENLLHKALIRESKKCKTDFEVAPWTVYPKQEQPEQED